MEKNNERCENCKYFHRLKINKRIPVTLPRNCNVVSGWSIDVVPNHFQETSCCIAFTRIGCTIEETDDYSAFVLEADKNDCCEMYEKRSV